MDLQSIDVLERSFNFRVKPASEYQRGERVILTHDVDFDVCILAGTEGILKDIGKHGREDFDIIFKGFRERTIASVYDIDSLDNGQGELFRTFHNWIPCRRDNERQGWLTAYGAPEMFRAKLDDGTIVEGRISMAGVPYNTRILTSVSIGGISYPANSIRNMVFRKGSRTVTIPIGGIESNFNCLLDELIQIWVNQGGFISLMGFKNKRVVEIGNAFYTTGKIERMQSAVEKINSVLGRHAGDRLITAWAGIG